MSSPETVQPRKWSSRKRITAGALGLTSLVGIGTAIELQKPHPVVNADPLSWVAGPLAKGIENITGNEPSKNERLAITNQANQISDNLYDEKKFPKGVRIPGILNGTVTIKDNHVGLPEVTYKNPIILKRKGRGTSPESFIGTWIGIPEHNEQGHVIIHPMQIVKSEGPSQTEVVHLNDSRNVIFQDAAIYASTVTNSPDQLMGFDVTGNGTFPSVEINASVAK